MESDFYIPNKTPNWLTLFGGVYTTSLNFKYHVPQYEHKRLFTLTLECGDGKLKSASRFLSQDLCAISIFWLLQ